MSRPFYAFWTGYWSCSLWVDLLALSPWWGMVSLGMLALNAYLWRTTK